MITHPVLRLRRIHSFDTFLTVIRWNGVSKAVDGSLVNMPLCDLVGKIYTKPLTQRARSRILVQDHFENFEISAATL